MFLSMMSHYIFHILSKQAKCKEIAGIWQELMMALSDVADGKSAELFRPLKEEGAQPRKLPVYREMYFSIAAAVYDRAKKNEKKHVIDRIAKRLKVKPSELKNFGKNLVRSDPNIKSTESNNYYDGVYYGQLRVDKKGHLVPGKGNPSPVDDWLKWFDNIQLLNEV